MADQITEHLTRLSMDLYKAAKERDAARAEADGLRALIEKQGRYCVIDCKSACGVASGNGAGPKCQHCPRRYIIELPERAKG